MCRTDIEPRMVQGGSYSIWSVYLHVWQILEHESLVEFWIEILPMNFCFVFRLFVREEIKLDEWIREPGGPVGWREVAALNYLHRGKVLIKIITKHLLLQQCLRRTKKPPRCTSNYITGSGRLLTEVV